MARLPDTGQRPTPRFGGGLQAPRVVESGLSQLGASIAGFGEALAKEKIKDDKYRTEDATTQLQNQMLDLAKGENGFTTFKSGDVANNKKFYEEQMTRFDSARKDIGDSLGSDEQRTMFNRRSDIARVGYGENLINHITQEKSAFNTQVYKGGVASERDIASSDYDNENVVKSALLRTEKLTEAELDRLGVKGDARKILLKENQSNIHEGVIQQSVDDGNYEYAKTWFEKNQKHILGDRQDDIKDLLRESGIKEKSQEFVDDYVGRELTETEAKAEARKLDPDVRDATIDRISARYGEAQQIKDREQKSSSETAWKIYAESGYDAIPISVLRGMDGKERAALKATAATAAKGVDVKTDFQTYYGLRQMASEDPAMFKEENLMKYANLLSPADRKELVKLQTDDKGITIARTKTQIMKQAANDVGIDKKQVKQGYGDDLTPFYKRIDEELEAFQITTGKEPTTKDISEITDRLSIEVIRDPEAWFFTGERPAVSAEIEGVPQDMIDEIAQVLVNINQPVTDENIQKQWRFISEGPAKGQYSGRVQR